MEYPESGSNLHWFILRQHGRDVLQMLRKLERTVDKLARWKNHLIFNIRCVKCNFTPKTLKLHSPVNGLKASRILKKTERRLLNIRIAQCTFTIRKLKDERTKIEEELYGKVGDASEKLQQHIEAIYKWKFEETKTSQKKKFEKLRETHQQEIIATE